jgi:hypothetical protein
MAKRRGITLLELILALGLSGLVLYAVAMSIDLHLRVLDVRRTNVEEAQVARAVLHMIANDLRSTVRQYRMDMSAAVAQAAVAQAAVAQAAVAQAAVVQAAVVQAAVVQAAVVQAAVAQAAPAVRRARRPHRPTRAIW